MLMHSLTNIETLLDGKKIEWIGLNGINNNPNVKIATS